jgi:putative membrane protein
MPTIFAFLHHLAAFALVSALAIEFVLLRSALSLESARRLQVADMILGASAGVLLVVGSLRVLYFEKGALYYMHSWSFIAKFSLFLLVALLSIVPTIEFVKWRGAVKQGQTPVVTAERMAYLRKIIHIELTGIVLIVLFAAMMARGVGMVP